MIKVTEFIFNISIHYNIKFETINFEFKTISSSEINSSSETDVTEFISIY